VIAALAVAGCGDGTDAGSGQVQEGPPGSLPQDPLPAEQDVTCRSCTVAGSGETACGVRWELFAAPLSGDAAGPGQGGEGVAATGFLRQHDPDGSSHDWPVDTILRCDRSADGHHVTALVTGTGAAGERFSLDARDMAATGTATLHLDALDRCGPACPAGECICPDTGLCEPCHETPHDPPVGEPPPPAGEEPPPVVEEPPVVTPPPGETPPPPPPTDAPPPPPPPFIPL
jgi:hypothetical protein